MPRTEQFASQLPIRCGGADNGAQSVDQRRLAGMVSGYVSDRRGKFRGPPGIIRNIFRPALASEQEYGVPVAGIQLAQGTGITSGRVVI